VRQNPRNAGAATVSENYALPREALLVRGRKSNDCIKKALLRGALLHRLPLLETLYRVAANGFPFDAAQLEDIGGLIDGCLVSF
jgi:hypothetical protein